MFKKIIYLLSTVLLSTSCSQKSTCEIPKNLLSSDFVLDNLVGVWRLDDQKHIEIWDKPSSKFYRSRVFSINGSDSTLEETAKIFFVKPNWIFETQVLNQNEGEKIQFESNFSTSSEIHFSNPAHDFPSEIGYHVLSKTHLKAFIVGKNQQGNNDTIFFNYQRIDQK